MQKEHAQQQAIVKVIKKLIKQHKSRAKTDERRGQERVDFVQPVKIRTEDGKEFAILSRDLSATGVRLLGTKRLLGQKVQLELPNGSPPCRLSVASCGRAPSATTCSRTAAVLWSSWREKWIPRLAATRRGAADLAYALRVAAKRIRSLDPQLRRHLRVDFLDRVRQRFAVSRHVLFTIKVDQRGQHARRVAAHVAKENDRLRIVRFRGERFFKDGQTLLGLPGDLPDRECGLKLRFAVLVVHELF